MGLGMNPALCFRGYCELLPQASPDPYPYLCFHVQPSEKFMALLFYLHECWIAPCSSI